MAARSSTQGQDEALTGAATRLGQASGQVWVIGADDVEGLRALPQWSVVVSSRSPVPLVHVVPSGRTATDEESGDVVELYDKWRGWGHFDRTSAGLVGDHVGPFTVVYAPGVTHVSD